MRTEGRSVPPSERPSRSREANHLIWAPWWLHPRFAFLFLGLFLLILAYLIPESTYLTLYRSAKHVDFNFLVLGLLVYGGFLAGSFFAVGTGSRPQERDVLMYCRTFVWPLFVLTVLSYVVWFGYAVVLEGPGLIVNALQNLLFESSVGSSDYVKTVLFPTIPGVTTFTHASILYATVEALLWVRRGSWSRVAVARFAVVLFLVLLQTLLLSERLALLETVIPAAIILFSHVAPNTIKRTLVQLAPLFLGLVVFSLFTFGEYFRSWNFYRATYAGPYLQFAAERFLGYYTTAINNAAVVYYYEPLQPLRYTLNDLFVFPGLGEFASRGYAEILGREYLESSLFREQLLRIYANPELNNLAPVGLLLSEYSMFLAPIAAFLIGLLSSSIYKSFIKGRLVGALLYPSWFVGLLEISRVYYWPDQRYFPVLVLLLISLLMFKAAKVPLRNPPLVRGHPERAFGRRQTRQGAG